MEQETNCWIKEAYLIITYADQNYFGHFTKDVTAKVTFPKPHICPEVSVTPSEIPLETVQLLLDKANTALIPGKTLTRNYAYCPQISKMVVDFTLCDRFGKEEIGQRKRITLVPDGNSWKLEGIVNSTSVPLEAISKRLSLGIEMWLRYQKVIEKNEDNSQPPEQSISEPSKEDHRILLDEDIIEFFQGPDYSERINEVLRTFKTLCENNSRKAKQSQCEQSNPDK